MLRRNLSGTRFVEDIAVHVTNLVRGYDQPAFYGSHLLQDGCSFGVPQSGGPCAGFLKWKDNLIDPGSDLLSLQVVLL